MPERGRFLLFWMVVLAAGGLSIGALGTYGFHVAAFGFLYAALATSWSWLRSTGLFSFGHAAFFGAGALTQAWPVTVGGMPPWRALGASALAGTLVAFPLIPALRLAPTSFALATLAYASLLKGTAAIVPAVGTEGFLLPAFPGFDGAESRLTVILALLALAVSLGYRTFLGRPGGRCAGALRQAPETAVSLGIDPIGGRWRLLVLSAAATSLAGALYAHLVGSVETSVVFSPMFSLLPIVLGMLGGALHPLGGILGTLVIYPLDELILRPALLEAHSLAYGVVLIGLLLFKPEGILRAPVPGIPAATVFGRTPHKPFSLGVSRLTVRRNTQTVVRDVSFEVEPGQVLRVHGPNGAGKTSLLLAIAGRIRVRRGEILFEGTPPPRLAAARARCGLARTFQAPRPFAGWTVRENVAFAAECAGAPGEVDGLLEDLELTALADRPAGQLSVGEGRRLELARALAFRPAALLLDEPLAGLTPRAAQKVSGLIEGARRQGAAVIWVQHGPVAGDPADGLLVLEQGEARFLGPLGDWEAARGAVSS